MPQAGRSLLLRLQFFPQALFESIIIRHGYLPPYYPAIKTNRKRAYCTACGLKRTRMRPENIPDTTLRLRIR